MSRARAWAVVGVCALAVFVSLSSCALESGGPGDRKVQAEVWRINAWVLEYPVTERGGGSVGQELRATKTYDWPGDIYRMVVTGDTDSVLYAVNDSGFGLVAEGEQLVDEGPQTEAVPLEEGRHYTIDIEVSRIAGTAASAARATSVPDGNIVGDAGPLGADAWVLVETPAVLGTIKFYVAQHDSGSGQYDWSVSRWQVIGGGAWLELYAETDITDYDLHSYQFFYAFFKRYLLKVHTDTSGVIVVYSIDWWF